MIAIGGSGKAVVWRNETGMALNPRTEEPFRYGLVGSPDIIGFLENGKFIGFECKTGSADQSKEQKAFEAACHRMKAHYFVVHSAEEARECLKLSLGETCPKCKGPTVTGFGYEFLCPSCKETFSV